MSAASKNAATVLRGIYDENKIAYDPAVMAEMEAYCDEPATPLLDREPNQMLRAVLQDLRSARRGLPDHEQCFHEVQLDLLDKGERPRPNQIHAAYTMIAFHAAGREAPPEEKPLCERINALAHELQLKVEYSPQFGTVLFCARGPWRY